MFFLLVDDIFFFTPTPKQYTCLVLASDWETKSWKSQWVENSHVQRHTTTYLCFVCGEECQECEPISGKKSARLN